MAERRRPFAGLLRALDAAKQPVYLIDGRRRLAFLNDACLTWLGRPWTDLLDRPCFGPPPQDAGDGPEAIVAALAPPPSVELGVPVRGEICLPGEPLRRRGAVFFALPLDDSAADRQEQAPAVLAIVDPVDLPLAREPAGSASKPATEVDDDRWHAWVQTAVREAVRRHGTPWLIGRSPAARLLARQIEAAAASRANLLLIGPPGSKTVELASAVHFGTQPESAGALVPVDCAVLDDDTIRSNIRVVAVGAGAVGANRRTTILLKGIDALSPQWQQCVAEEIGDSRFPLRIIATVERPGAVFDYRKELAPDLAAVVAAMVVRIAPLATRREDIPPLAQYFLEQCNASGGKQVERFSPEALDMLDLYHWPGDMAELEQFVAEAHTRAAGATIAAANLPPRVHWTLDAHRRRRTSQIVSLDTFLERTERELIERALRRAGGNRAKAARLLGVSRPRLYRRMAALGLIDAAAEAEKAEPMRRSAVADPVERSQSPEAIPDADTVRPPISEATDELPTFEPLPDNTLSDDRPESSI